MGDISIKGKSPILRQGFAVGGAVRRLGKALRGRKGRGKDFKTHGKDVPTMAAKGGRIGLNNGGKPWGAGPKPGSIEFFQSTTQTPKRKGKAIGGAIKKVIQGGKKIIDKIKTGKSNKFDTWETIGIPGSPGPKKGKYKHIDTIMESIEKQKKTGKAAGGRIGKAVGGRIGYKVGYHVKPKPKEWPPRDWQKFKPRTWPKQKSLIEQAGGSEKAKPHSTKEGRIASGTRRIKRFLQSRKGTPVNPKGTPGQKPEWKKMPWKPGQKPNLQPLKKGGKADKNWIQKAVNPKHKGFCTPMTKKTCTPRRKALARTFKKMGRERKAKG